MDILLRFVTLLLSLLFLLNNNYQINANSATHKLTKRLDADICADHFDTRSSTIIRTEESRAMGAKFINDDDVSSAAACMKLCCESADCDVFVFEEKSSGSCFLFHCGTSDDFRCKFTTHSNYTSGVLTVTRSELESPATTTTTTVAPPKKKQKMSQNELELVNLKRPSSSYHLSSDSVTSTTTSTVAPPFAVRLADSVTTSTVSSVAVTKPSPCGRFQFECQTSKECIAIYNVCDQITQCEDGSDEGPECATAASSGGRKDGRNGGVVNNFVQMPRQMIHNREDPLTAPKFPTLQNPIYSDAETDNVVGNQPAFPNRRPSSKSDRIQPNQYLVPQTPQQTLDEPMYREQQLQWPQLSPKQTNSIWPEKPGRKSNQFEDSKSTGRKQKVDMDDSEYSEEYVDENRIENNNRNNNEEVSTTTAAPQKKKPRKHKKVKGQQQSKEKSLHEQLKQLKTSPSDVDVQAVEDADEPTGAVLSLTLGCLILAALSILISVRLRSVKIRGRRRGGKSTEEADYLVNGLYL